MRHDRASDLEVQVLHGPARLVRQHIAFADVDAAGEPNQTVGHEKFPVVVEVHGGQPPRRERRQKSRDRHPCPFQFAHDRGPGIARAGIINQHAHPDATCRGPAQRFGELVPDAVVVKDVGGQ